MLKRKPVLFNFPNDKSPVRERRRTSKILLRLENVESIPEGESAILMKDPGVAQVVMLILMKDSSQRSEEELKLLSKLLSHVEMLQKLSPEVRLECLRYLKYYSFEPSEGEFDLY